MWFPYQVLSAGDEKPARSCMNAPLNLMRLSMTVSQDLHENIDMNVPVSNNTNICNAYAFQLLINHGGMTIENL
jgi:hypothetical protein